MKNLLANILICPSCKFTGADNLMAGSQKCSRCHTEFFDLLGLSCHFPSGKVQKYLWEDLLAKFITEMAGQKKAHLENLAGYHQTRKTKKRMEVMQEVRLKSQEGIIKILRDAGLSPKRREEFSHFGTKGFTQYFELLLRDWGWQASTQASEGELYREYEDENQYALGHLEAQLPETFKAKKILVIGSGAGRLSWDLHQYLKPNLTVALDSNPLLAFVSHAMVKLGKEYTLQEARLYPHAGLPQAHSWMLKDQSDAQTELRDSWVAMGADAWAAPFKDESFDLIVTPWFMDINGQDSKKTIAVVDRLIEPGGYCLNYGPFLYPEELPEDQKYTPDEIREFLQLCNFSLESESFHRIPYTYSPLNERGRIEEVWAFLAKMSDQKTHLDNAGETSEPVYKHQPPPWLILPHLPIPQLTQPGLIPEDLKNISQLIDGNTSINALAEMLNGKMPEGTTGEEFVYQFLEAFILN